MTKEKTVRLENNLNSKGGVEMEPKIYYLDLKKYFIPKKFKEEFADMIAMAREFTEFKNYIRISISQPYGLNLVANKYFISHNEIYRKKRELHIPEIIIFLGDSLYLRKEYVYGRMSQKYGLGIMEGELIIDDKKYYFVRTDTDLYPYMLYFLRDFQIYIVIDVINKKFYEVEKIQVENLIIDKEGTITEKGYSASWERGKGHQNIGTGIIYSNPDGSKPKALFTRKERALIPVKEGMYTIHYRRQGGGKPDIETVYRVREIIRNDREIYIVLEKVKNPPTFLDEARAAAKEKAYCYHCKKVLYANL